MNWTLRCRVARRLHILVNWLAWRFARLAGPQWGIALRIDKSRPLWRLNDWLASKWTHAYVSSTGGKLPKRDES